MFVGGLESYLQFLCLFAYSGVQYILCCVFALFVFVLCTLCRQFLWIVHFCLPLWFSLTFISYFESKVWGMTFIINIERIQTSTLVLFSVMFCVSFFVFPPLCILLYVLLRFTISDYTIWHNKLSLANIWYTVDQFKLCEKKV
jgi:hypothetical protein